MVDVWTFYECEPRDGEWLVTEHLQSGSSETEVKFNERCRHLVQRAVHDWTPIWTKTLHGECEGLIEVRFKSERVQQRPLAFFGPRQSELTFVFWATEKNDKLKPKDACKIGRERAEAITSGKLQVRTLTFE